MEFEHTMSKIVAENDASQNDDSQDEIYAESSEGDSHAEASQRPKVLPEGKTPASPHRSGKGSKSSLARERKHSPASSGALSESANASPQGDAAETDISPGERSRLFLVKHSANKPPAPENAQNPPPPQAEPSEKAPAEAGRRVSLCEPLEPAPRTSGQDDKSAMMYSELLEFRRIMTSCQAEMLHALDDSLAKVRDHLGSEVTFNATSGWHREVSGGIIPTPRLDSTQSQPSVGSCGSTPLSPRSLNEEILARNLGVLPGSLADSGREDQPATWSAANLLTVLPDQPARRAARTESISSVQSRSGGAPKPSRSRRSWIPDQGAQTLVTSQSKGLEKKTKKMSSEEKAKLIKEAQETLQKGDVFKGGNPQIAKQLVRTAMADDTERRNQDLYKEDGFCQKVARSSMFEKVTLTIILLNAIWMGFDAEFNPADIIMQAPVGFIVAENLFCVFFCAELTIRFMAYARFQNLFRDAWFMFDFFLVVSMVLETWIMPLVQAVMGSEGSGSMVGGASILRIGRMMRILRTARMARLVRMMPELMILVKGLLVASRSVFFTLVLLMIITYVFAIAFMQLAKDTPEVDHLFGSFGDSMLNLILHCILPDQEVFVRGLAGLNPILAAAALMFILFGSLTVMNMLLGVLVEAVKTVSQVEREHIDVSYARKIIFELLQKENADENGDSFISEQEFVALLSKPVAARTLTSLGVDVVGAIDYGKMLFEDGEPLSFPDFMNGMLMLRGTNNTTVKDIVDLRKFVAEEFEQIQSFIGQLSSGIALAQDDGFLKGSISRISIPSLSLNDP
eukprot:CAMPEP_0197631874 /NCGR_PEP_ID=MMETSP1338-20131121/8893_1 /TAXON_ID=43686 ORGANISM="Pelagodinium beii, Strain RCC1491" /NCGR_SAMPLE_ID=MMETSP1338 /ASSEMBLY_ACC=CAM_ASM_000754 /LENGTH=796 /DNA_ID=CAMNT_0043203413 /DNA_START=72 /DNA_END=2462 /DNA_ORIENTATION=+